MTGWHDTSALRTLVDVIEPVKDYAREEQASTPPTSLTPLNRAIDAARPESETARRFAQLVSDFVSGKIKPGSEDEIRSLLETWRDNDTRLRPFLGKSSFVGELVPHSQALSALGTAGQLRNRKHRFSWRLRPRSRCSSTPSKRPQSNSTDGHHSGFHLPPVPFTETLVGTKFVPP
jgi:hypothetical protein